MIAYVQLLGCILGPLLVTAILIYLKGVFSREGEPSRKIVKTLIYELSLHPEKGLADQGLLWVSILLPLIYFLTLGGFAWQDTTPSLSAEGFNTFIEISKLPLALLALCVPLAVLASRLHATKQTAAQLISARKKNNYDLFLSHRKSMIEYFSAVENVTFGRGAIKYDFRIDPHLHSQFFHADDPLKGIPEVRAKNFEIILRELCECGDLISEFFTSTVEVPVSEEYALRYIDISRRIYNLALKVGLREITDMRDYCITVDCGPSTPTTMVFVLGKSYSEFTGSFQLLRSYIRYLCRFASYRSSYFEENRHHYHASAIGLSDDGDTEVVKSVIKVANRLASENGEQFLVKIKAPLPVTKKKKPELQGGR